MRCYAGIGARKTPTDILKSMKSVAKFLAQQGFVLRSGGADGADAAFEEGCDLAQGKKEIYLPWEHFNKSKSHLFITRLAVNPVAVEMAKKHHPAWKKLNIAAQKMMVRNCHQIKGNSLAKDCEFVLCWTPEGKVTGGTGQALRIANHYNIPVLNFGSQSLPEIEKSILEILKN